MAQPGTIDPVTPASGGPRGCSNCGAGNPATARFCAQCGKGLPPLNGGAPGSVNALLDSARQHVLLGHWEDAALAAEAALALDPNSAEGHHIAAQARLKQGMPAGALHHAERAVELDGANAEYQATLAQAMHGGSSSTIASPAILASAAAVAVIALVIVLAFTGKPKPKAAPAPAPAQPTGAASPFAQPPPNAAYPQPARPSGVDLDGPRVPARTAPPGPPTAANSGGGRPETGSIAGALPSASGLAPAPVDTSTLQRFAAPEPPAQQPAVAVPTPAPAPPAAHTPSRPIPPIVPPLSQAQTQHGGVAPPPPASNSIFGPGTAARPPAASEAPASAAPPPAAQQAPPRATVTPQQQYVERNYGAAAQGYQRQIEAGNATGAKYQQLGLSYERLGDRQKAAQAYQNAIAAYKAQMQAGQDPEVASRGLRSTQRALNMLQGR